MAWFALESLVNRDPEPCVLSFIAMLEFYVSRESCLGMRSLLSSTTFWEIRQTYVRNDVTVLPVFNAGVVSCYIAVGCIG